jgi:hypothetical protein
MQARAALVQTSMSPDTSARMGYDAVRMSTTQCLASSTTRRTTITITGTRQPAASVERIVTPPAPWHGDETEQQGKQVGQANKEGVTFRPSHPVTNRPPRPDDLCARRFTRCCRLGDAPARARP